MQDSNTDNKVFNLGSGLNYSVNEIYTLISKKLNSNIKPIYKETIAGEAQETLSDIVFTCSPKYFKVIFPPRL